jgi:hypothetical protein
MQIIQELVDNDPECGILRANDKPDALMDNNQMSLASIVFSDESTFTLHGEVNRHNWDITLTGCQKLILSSRKNSFAR